MKLNLGAGKWPIDGYVSVDLYDESADGIKLDCKDILTYFGENSIEEIISLHLVEHFEPYEMTNILNNWLRTLEPGGRLILELPDIEALCAHYAAADKPERYHLINCMFGAARPGTPHLYGWDREIMTDHLTWAGFTDIKVLPEQFPHWGYNMRIEATKPSKKIKHTVVIPTYNNLENFLMPCVDSIIKYTDLSDKEIVIVANGCTDGTKEYLAGLPDGFTTLWFDEPLGFAKATNKGVQYSLDNAVEYITLLNNDTILLGQEKDTWIKMMEEPFKDPDVGLTGPMIGWSDPAGSDFLIFFCTMIHRKVFEKIGLLDESFGKGAGEDTLACVKAMEAGFKMVQVPTDKNFHWEAGFGMVGGFPIYHKGEATMHNKDLVSDWDQVFHDNSIRLAEKCGTGWTPETKGKF